MTGLRDTAHCMIDISPAIAWRSDTLSIQQVQSQDNANENTNANANANASASASANGFRRYLSGGAACKPPGALGLAYPGLAASGVYNVLRTSEGPVEYLQ